MNDLPILVAGQTRDLTLDGTRYTVRALTHGQHALLQVALAAQQVPSTEMINDTLRQVAEAAGRPDLAEALVAEEEATDALNLAFASQPPGLDDLGQHAWEQERAAELRPLRLAVQAARRRARLAREKFATDPAAVRITEQAASAMWTQTRHLVAAGLAEIDGKPVSVTADDVGNMPSGHVKALAALVNDLLTPTRDAAKN